MNILIKLMSIVSLVIAPTLASIHKPETLAGKIEKKELKISKVVGGDTKVGK